MPAFWVWLKVFWLKSFD